MSYAEFPHTNYEDTDLRELIALYKKLVDDYDGTLEKINEVSARLDEYQNTMTPYINQQVDSRVQIAIQNFSSTIEADINSINLKITNLNNKTDKIQSDMLDKIEALDVKINGEIGDLENTDMLLMSQLTTLNTALNQTNETIEKNRQQAIADLTAATMKLNKEIANKADATLVESKLYTIQQIEALANMLNSRIDSIAESTGADAVRWLWQYGCCGNGLSAGEWYNMQEVTCEDWHKMNLTCVEWYTESREAYWRFDSRRKMFSPVTGEFVTVQQAVLELAAAVNPDMIKAGIYDNMKVTADEYDNMNMTAQEYDWGCIKEGEDV